MTRPRVLKSADFVPVDGSVIMDGYSEPFELVPGHPLRGSRCLACAGLVGPRKVRLYSVIMTSGAACSCGGVPTATFLVCAAHGTDDDGTTAAIAIERHNRHHGGRA
jgi:hypothetical protein